MSGFNCPKTMLITEFKECPEERHFYSIVYIITDITKKQLKLLELIEDEGGFAYFPYTKNHRLLSIPITNVKNRTLNFVYNELNQIREKRKEEVIIKIENVRLHFDILALIIKSKDSELEERFLFIGQFDNEFIAKGFLEKYKTQIEDAFLGHEFRLTNNQIYTCLEGKGISVFEELTEKDKEEFKKYGIPLNERSEHEIKVDDERKIEYLEKLQKWVEYQILPNLKQLPQGKRSHYRNLIRKTKDIEDLKAKLSNINETHCLNLDCDNLINNYVELYKKEIELLNSTSTVFTPSTPFYILQPLRAWGGFYPEIKLHIERINNDSYIYNYNGKRGLVSISYESEESENKKYKTKKACLLIEGETFYFKNNKIENKPYRTPSLILINKYLEGNYKSKSFKEIAELILNRLKTIYEFSSDADPYIITLFVGQSYLKPLIPSFFYLGIDGTKGSGKTTQLEIAMTIARHGLFAGDISASVIPRMIEDHDLSLGVDEIDQKIGREGDIELASILRKGQRKNNFYVRCRKNTLEPEYFDVAGAHAYSFRSEVEDAFAQRTINTHTSPSSDSKLPIINLYKENLLQPITDDLFFWSIENMIKMADLSYFNKELNLCVEGCSDVKAVEGILTLRNQIYNQVTENLSKEELGLLQNLIGRNVELCYMAIEIAKILGWDKEFFEHLKKVIEVKQSDEKVSYNYYLEVLENVLKDIYLLDADVLKEGTNEQCKYYPKNLTFEKFTEHLTLKRMTTLSPQKFTSLLRDIGFEQNISIKSQRWRTCPKPCLIFIPKIVNRINPESDKKDYEEQTETPKVSLGDK